VKIRIINKEWEELKEVNLKVLPRQGECLYLNNVYYRVVEVIHTCQKPFGVCIVVDKIPNEKIK
jgi:hypothetical protein